MSRKKLGNILLILVGIILAVIATLFIILMVWSPGTIDLIRDEDGNVIEGSISEIVTLPTGGVDQGMILKGTDVEKPVLLFLHGGPGTAEYVFLKNYDIRLEDHFTVCWWEQRGAGRSYDSSIPPESMTLEQLMADTVEITNYLRERFNKDKIYLMGHSWGTFLGVYTAQQHPELFEAYIGIGQVGNQMESELLAYDYMLKTAILEQDKKLEKELLTFTIDSPDSLDLDYIAVRTYAMDKQGIGVVHEMNSEFQDIILPLLKFKEYTIAQKIGFAKGSSFSLTHLFGTVLEHDLSKEVPRLEIPVYIMHGAYDMQVSYDLAKEYFDVLEAPKKQFYTFEHSAHSPMIEETEKFMDIIVTDVLGE